MGVILYSTRSAEESYRALRKALQGQFGREYWSSGGSDVQLCQVCQEDRAGQGWEGKADDPGRMCARCWAEGYYPWERRGGAS